MGGQRREDISALPGYSPEYWPPEGTVTMPLSPENQRLAEELDAQFAAEDREIAQEVARRKRTGEPEPQRDLRGFQGFASSAASGRDED